MSRSTKRTLVAFAVGLVFGVGLIVGGMTQPAKVIGFLNFTGDWDPSLAFVMGGAVAVFMPLFRLVQRRNAPVCDTRFGIPKRTDVDAPLLVGSALFGIGWGLGGLCPGPALAGAGAMVPNALVFTVAMLAGFAIERTTSSLIPKRGSSPPESVSSSRREQPA